MTPRPDDDDWSEGSGANPYASLSSDSPSELPCDEAILWTGRPELRLFLREMLGSFSMGVMPLCVGLFLIFLSWSFRFNLGGTVAGIVFLGAGIYALSSLWRYYQRLRAAVYAITDQRAIVLRPVAWCQAAPCVLPYRQAYSFYSPAVRRRQMRSRGAGRMDIVMGREKHASAKGLPRFHEVGFLGLTDVTEPEKFLQQLIDGQADSQDEAPGDGLSAEAFQPRNSDPSRLNGGLVGVLPASDDDPVRLVGESVLGRGGVWLQWAPYYLAVILFAAVLFPWAVALVRIWRAGLMQALPTPLIVATFVFMMLTTWPLIRRWWLPPCRRFELDGQRLRYWPDLNRPAVERSAGDITRIRPIESKSRVCGYLIEFRGGGRLYVNRSLTHADDLFLEINSRLS